MNMIVNDIDISTYGSILLTADYGYAEVTTYEDWLRGSRQPLFYEQTVTYTKAQYEILVEGIDLDDLEKNCSNLYSAMQKATVKVEGHSWSLDGWLTSASDERVSPFAKVIDIEFQGIKIADRETQSHTFSLLEEWEFEIPGNSEVPVRVEITPDMGYATFELTLNGTTYVIDTIGSSSSLLLIDSEQGIVTLDNENKIEDYESWELPFLVGGTNTMSTNGAPTVTISYNGRWK